MDFFQRSARAKAMTTNGQPKGAGSLHVIFAGVIVSCIGTGLSSQKHLAVTRPYREQGPRLLLQQILASLFSAWPARLSCHTQALFH